MRKTKVYQFQRPYDVATDTQGIARRWATREAIERIQGTVLPETETKIYVGWLDGNGMTPLDFDPQKRLESVQDLYKEAVCDAPSRPSKGSCCRPSDRDRQ